MSGTVVLLLYILAILVVVLIHEAAHFGVAKAFGIKVEEFFVGFGPRIWSFRRGETEYGLKALPFGGYVRIAGMNPFQEPTPEEYPRTFGAKPVWQRALVIAAGPATHFVIAFIIFAAYLGFLGQPSKYAPLIGGVDAKINGEVSPARAAGLRPGDEVVGVGNIDHPSDQEFVDYTRAHVGDPIRLRVDRDGTEKTFTVTPVLDRTVEPPVGRIGVALTVGTILARDREGFSGAITGGASAVGETSWLVVKSLGRVFGPEGIGRIVTLLFTGEQRQVDDVSSVVGGGRVVVQAADQGFGDLLFLILAQFNVFVGILNLLPIPPFDGGHLAVLAMEKIRRRKVDPRKLVPLTAVVAAFLILFMMSVLYLDIVKPIPNPFQ